MKVLVVIVVLIRRKGKYSNFDFELYLSFVCLGWSVVIGIHELCFLNGYLHLKVDVCKCFTSIHNLRGPTSFAGYYDHTPI